MLLFLRQTEVYDGDQPLRLLHIAPEECLRRELSVLPHLDYLTGDLFDDDVDLKGLDLTEIPFPTSSLNVLICSHVLEHILDDRRAMREMRRVLVPGGWALISGPTHPERAETYEDSRIVAPEERLAHFGQEDHVRIYRRSDFINRLEAAGFDVAPNPGSFTEAQRRRYLIGDDCGRDQSYFCRPANS